MSAGDQRRYRLEARIATGGMGEVWRATDTLLDRDVAVKVLKDEYADDPAFRARFQAEARHAAALYHPNVASVFDFGELPSHDGSGVPRPYLVMELVPGQPLSMLLRGSRPLDPWQAAVLVAQAADAIAEAHRLGIVHRDVKPANLLVTPGGTVKITDFGIARAGDGAALTQTGQIVGTPHYISPEQAEGKPATPASDIYGLGVVLYECLAGRRPFEADTPISVALAHMNAAIPPLPDSVPAPLREATHRALAKDPGDRFASAADLSLALRGGQGPGYFGAAAPATAVLAGGGAAVPAPTGPGGRRTVPPWWPWATAVAVLLLVVLTTSAFADRAGGPEEVTAAGGTGNPPAAPAADDEAPRDTRVRLVAADYLGRDHKDVQRELEDFGLDVEVEETPAGSPEHEKGTVADVSPVGPVEPGATVTLTVWEEYDEPEVEDAEDSDEKPDKEPKGKAKGHEKHEDDDEDDDDD